MQPCFYNVLYNVLYWDRHAISLTHETLCKRPIRPGPALCLSPSGRMLGVDDVMAEVFTSPRRKADRRNRDKENGDDDREGI